MPVNVTSEIGRLRAVIVHTPGPELVRCRGRLLACVPSHKSAEPDSLAVRTDFETRAALLAEQPETFYLKDHYVNYTVVLVRLSKIKTEQLRDLLESARRFVEVHEGRNERGRRRPRKPLE